MLSMRLKYQKHTQHALKIIKSMLHALESIKRMLITGA
jgi:hypothetical protein